MRTLIHICFFFSTVIAHAQDLPTTTIYLIRHAEKSDNSPNPDLSPGGQERAQALAKYFDSLQVELFYSTPYKRTQQTCSPAATLKKREIITYDPDELDLKTIAAANPGKSILIIGHSNTIPAYINKLLGKRVYDDIPEDEYDHIYTITFRGDSIEHQTGRL